MAEWNLTKIIVLLSSILVLFLVILLLVKTYINPSDRYYEPDWVKKARSDVNPVKCAPDNCGACDASGCLKYSGSCYIAHEDYTCGFGCGGTVSYCKSK